jgi:uncharacterized tellurite resistance protein B-like protein
MDQASGDAARSRNLGYNRQGREGQMFEAFRRFVSDLSGGDKHPSGFDENDYRLSAAALLVHAAAIDGTVSDIEREALHKVIKRRFGLDDAHTDRLLAEATEAEQEAVDLYHFTSRLNRMLDEEGRLRIVEMMWEIVYADRHVGDFEENLIWRAADLLGVSSRERIELRHQVAERLAQGEGA